MNAKRIHENIFFSVNYVSLKEKTILIADSTFNDRPHLLNRLQLFVKNVRWIDSGEQLLLTLSKYTPDMVLCDYNLTYESNAMSSQHCEFDHRKALCAVLDLYPEIPVMVLINHSDIKEVSTLLRVGVQDVLFKPFTSTRQLLEPLALYFNHSSILDPTINYSREEQFDRQIDDRYYAEQELLSYMDHLKDDPESLFKLINKLMAPSKLCSIMTNNQHEQNWQFSAQRTNIKKERSTKYVRTSEEINDLTKKDLGTDPDRFVFVHYISLADQRVICYFLSVNKKEVSELTNALLIQILFDNYLNEKQASKKQLPQFVLYDLVNHIEQGLFSFMQQTDLAAYFCLFDFNKQEIEVLPAGLDMQVFNLIKQDNTLENKEDNYKKEEVKLLHSKRHNLGQNATKNLRCFVNFSQYGCVLKNVLNEDQLELSIINNVL